MESSNIVGYSTRSMPANKFRMLSMPWETIDGSVNINKIMPYQSNVTVDWVAIGDGDVEIEQYFAVAPQVQVQIISGAAEGAYRTYYYINNAYVGDDPDTGDIITKAGWCDASGVYVDGIADTDGDGSITPGVSVWFKDPSVVEATPVTGSGAVPSEDVTINCPDKFRLRAPGFPVVLNINNTEEVQFIDIDGSIEVDWVAIGDGDKEIEEYFAIAPQIQVQITSGAAEGAYRTYYYIKNAYVGDDPDTGDLITRAGWCDASGVYVDGIAETDGDGKVPVNGAFWTKASADHPFTMKLIAPVK